MPPVPPAHPHPHPHTHTTQPCTPGHTRLQHQLRSAAARLQQVCAHGNSSKLERRYVTATLPQLVGWIRAQQLNGSALAAGQAGQWRPRQTATAAVPT